MQNELIKEIYPIITPQLCFIDKFRQCNAYKNMNPAMYIDKDGLVTILVRNINYSKFYNKHFTIFEQGSNSFYIKITGSITNSKLCLKDITHLICHKTLPVYLTCWKGIEDIRFIDEKNILIIIPECNINGNPSVFRGVLEENNIHSISDCKPNIIEKNWLPYKFNQTYNVIYKLYPFTIKSIDNDDPIIIENSPIELKGCNGSTNGINILNTNNILFLVHANLEKCYHRWMIFNPITNEIKVSKLFVFFTHSFIEFCCSLSEYQNQLYVGIGINDEQAFILRLDLNDVIKLFD